MYASKGMSRAALGCSMDVRAVGGIPKRRKDERVPTCMCDSVAPTRQHWPWECTAIDIPKPQARPRNQIKESMGIRLVLNPPPASQRKIQRPQQIIDAIRTQMAVCGKVEVVSDEGVVELKSHMRLAAWEGAVK